jgi:hypothetical protein
MTTPLIAVVIPLAFLAIFIIVLSTGSTLLQQWYADYLATKKQGLSALLTTVFTFILATATVFLVITSIIQHYDAITALHISERAYITIDSPNLSISDKVMTLPLTNTGRIPSGNIQAIVHAATFNSELSNKCDPETGTPAELGWRRHRISSLPPGKDLITVAIPLPEFAEAKYTPEGVFQIILVVGRVSYGDGFPDDGEQEWPFCYQSVYHTSLKKIFLIPCDAARWLPVLEKRDGYPNNEQRD